MMKSLQTSFWEATTWVATSVTWRLTQRWDTMYLSCSFSFACSLPLIAPWHFWVSLLSRQQAAVQRETEHEEGADKKHRDKTKRDKRQSGTERGMDEVRRGDIRTDTVQQTESYGDIWRIHEAVMNLFGFFYRSTRVSLMAN